MSDEPYRPAPSPGDPDAELARLAAEGQRRIHDAASTRVAASAAPAVDVRDDILRTALGLYYGTAARKVAAVLLAAGVLSIAGAIATCAADGGIGQGTWQRTPAESVALQLLGFALVGVGIAMSVRTPRAAPARVAAERAWVSSLPFALERYFETVASPGTRDSTACRLVVELTLRPGPPVELSMLQGAVGVVDADARVTADGSSLRIISAVMPRTSSGSELHGNNRQIVGYMHAMVDRVLLPLHRGHPLERIGLRSDSDLNDADRRAVERLDVQNRKW